MDVEKRIVNGIIASDFVPYQASIRVSVRDYARFGRGHTCGAVLVKSQTVLTAAHCLMSGESYRTPFDIHVVFGSLNRYTYTKDTRIEHVERIIVHPEYQRFDSFAHDIGIVLVSRLMDCLFGFICSILFF
jgi:secreted trypsin-like serine protease